MTEHSIFIIMSKSNFLIITVCITEDKIKCIFPFEYKEVIYYDCTNFEDQSGAGWYWCVTSENTSENGTVFGTSYCGDCSGGR